MGGSTKGNNDGCSSILSSVPILMPVIKIIKIKHNFSAFDTQNYNIIFNMGDRQ